MAFYYAFTCDVCGQINAANPVNGSFSSYQLPKGWRGFDGRHMCGLECVAKYCRQPDKYPAQKKDPDPFLIAMSKAFKESTPEKAS